MRTWSQVFNIAENPYYRRFIEEPDSIYADFGVALVW